MELLFLRVIIEYDFLCVRVYFCFDNGSVFIELLLNNNIEWVWVSIGFFVVFLVEVK